MTFYLKCKGCEHRYPITLGAEYFLPRRCPQCGYEYHDDAALRNWLAQLEREWQRGRDPQGDWTRG